MLVMLDEILDQSVRESGAPVKLGRRQKGRPNVAPYSDGCLRGHSTLPLGVRARAGRVRCRACWWHGVAGASRRQRGYPIVYWRSGTFRCPRNAVAARYGRVECLWPASIARAGARAGCPRIATFGRWCHASQRWHPGRGRVQQRRTHSRRRPGGAPVRLSTLC